MFNVFLTSIGCSIYVCNLVSCIMPQKTVILLYYLLTGLQNIVYSCSRHDVVAARLTSARPSSVIPLSKTFTLLEIHS